MKTYWNYKEEDSTLLLNQFLNGILPPGVYGGFDVVAFDGSMRLRLSQNNAVEEISIAGASKKIGVIKTKQGVIVAEDSQVELIIDPTTTLPRIDVIILQHQYQAVINSSIPFYSIIKGTPATNPTPPSLTIPAYQMKIGELRLPAGCNALNVFGVEWIKELSPILYRTPKTLLHATIVNNLTTNPGIKQNFTNFTVDFDTLNEFNASSGEFTAKNEGYYSFAWQCRIDVKDDYTGTQVRLGVATSIEKYNPLSAQWNKVVSTFINVGYINDFLQQGKSVSGMVFLKKGQKLRCSIENIGTHYVNSYDNDLFIHRID